MIFNGAGERITRNVLYTAITRARKRLKIYWSPETERLVLLSLKVKSDRKTAAVMKACYGNELASVPNNQLSGRQGQAPSAQAMVFTAIRELPIPLACRPL